MGFVTLLGMAGVNAQTISRVDVAGNQRVEAETIRSYLALRPGSSYDVNKVDQSLKSLFATGLFADVHISRSGTAVLVTVVENPLLDHVTFSGNKKVKRDQLLREIESQPRGTYNREKVDADSRRIQDVYRRQGYQNVQVSSQISELPQGRVDLTFTVNEGDKTRVEKISFIGNNDFSDGTLRDVITTTESNWLSFLKSSDIYDPDRLAVDQELLRRYYLKNGYADFRVVSAVADYDSAKNAHFITFTVEEGSRYTFGTVTVESNVPAVEASTLERFVKSPSGDTYNAELIDKTLEEMNTSIAKRGYPFAQVRPRGDRDYTNHRVNVAYVVEEGARTYVERINIRGNTRTMDQVIRREIEIAEGDAYNRVLADKAERRLNKMGYFKKVAVTREPGSAGDRVVMNIDVEEQPTGEISFGAGYATNDGFIVDVGLTEKNFLGRGQYLKTAVGWGQRRRNFDVSFVEPYFLDRRLSAGVSAFYRNTRADSTISSYQQEIYGGGLSLGVTLLEDLTFQTRLRGYQQNISVSAALQDCPTLGATDLTGSTGVGTGGPNSVFDCIDNGEASTAINASQGDAFISTLGSTLVYNKLDNNRNPRNGYFAEASADIGHVSADGLANPFTGLVNDDVDFIRSTADLRYYNNFYGDLVGYLRLQAGNISAINGEARLVDSFFKGGEFVRGFQNSGIGPRDLTPGFRGDSLGGTTYVGATAEVQFPFPYLSDELGLRGAVFADAGTIFDVGNLSAAGGPLLQHCTGANTPANSTCDFFDDAAIRSSVGVSISWQSPLGPIRFDFGFPLTKEDYDRTQVFRFSGGTSF